MTEHCACLTNLAWPIAMRRWPAVPRKTVCSFLSAVRVSTHGSGRPADRYQITSQQLFNPAQTPLLGQLMVVLISSPESPPASQADQRQNLSDGPECVLVTYCDHSGPLTKKQSALGTSRIKQCVEWAYFGSTSTTSIAPPFACPMAVHYVRCRLTV